MTGRASKPEEVSVTIATDCCTGPIPSALSSARTIEVPSSTGYLACKAAVDFILAVLLFIATLPLMILAMVLVKFTSPGPVVYSQTRAGRHGRPFMIYKIRSMVRDSEHLTGARWA